MMTDLKDAVDAAKARSSAEVVHRPQTAFDTVRRNETVLKTIGLNPSDPRAQAVVAVCDRYALDPVLGHIMIFGQGGLPYITRDGFLFIAHRSGQLDGIEVEDPHREGALWVAHASVWRKDMSRAFTYPGSADVGRDNGPEMAIARAERRALKRAFAVTLPREFAEDEWDTRAAPARGDTQQSNLGGAVARAAGDAERRGARPPEPAPLPDVEAQDYPEDFWDQPAPAKLVAEVHMLLRALGITERGPRLDIFTWIADRPVKSTKGLTLGEIQDVIAWLRDREHAAAAAATQAQPAADPSPPPAAPDDAEQPDLDWGDDPDPD